MEGDAAACEERAEERAAAAARMTVGDRGVMQRYHRLVADANAQEALAQQLEAELLTMQARRRATCSLLRVCSRVRNLSRKK